MKNLKNYIIEFIEDENTMHGADYLETLKNIDAIIEEIKEKFKEEQERQEQERQERALYVSNLYDEYIREENKQKGESGGMSWGEVAYIEGLTVEELEELENEILQNMEALKNV